MSPRPAVPELPQKYKSKPPAGRRRIVSEPAEKPDYSGWLTKQQAADAIGVSTKTIEKFAQEKKIEQAIWQRPTGGPAVAVFQPDDVVRLAKERRPDTVPFVMPMIAGAGTLAPRTSDDGTPSGLTALVAAALHALGSAAPEKFQKASPLFLTLAEAAEVSGLPQADLRRAIESGELKLRKTGRGGWRIRRRDLEAL